MQYVIYGAILAQIIIILGAVIGIVKKEKFGFFFDLQVISGITFAIVSIVIVLFGRDQFFNFLILCAVVACTHIVCGYTSYKKLKNEIKKLKSDIEFARDNPI